MAEPGLLTMCVYCGHRETSETPEAALAAIEVHTKACSARPEAGLRDELDGHEASLHAFLRDSGGRSPAKVLEDEAAERAAHAATRARVEALDTERLRAVIDAWANESNSVVLDTDIDVLVDRLRALLAAPAPPEG